MHFGRILIGRVEACIKHYKKEATQDTHTIFKPISNVKSTGGIIIKHVNRKKGDTREATQEKNKKGD